MSTPDIDTTDQHLILDHHRSPHHRGRLQAPTHTNTLRNPQCGDQVRLDLRLDYRDNIAEAWHEAKGCVISQAAASILCEHVEGKPLSDLAAMSPRDMLALLHIPLTPRRQQCALLPYFALKAIIASLDDKPSGDP